MKTSILDYLITSSANCCNSQPAIWDNDRTYSVDDLLHYSKNLATLLHRAHADVNAPIAVFLPKCAATVVADIGILYTGNCFANLDTKTPPERLKTVLENLSAPVIVTSPSFLSLLNDLAPATATLLNIDSAMVPDVLYSENELSAWRSTTIDTDPMCIIHTSGSTGIPKGVVLSHRGTIDFVDWVFERFPMGGDEVIGSLSPFYFDIYLLEFCLCLAKGAQLVILPENSAAFPSRLLGLLAAHSVTFIFWVPTIMVNIANQNLLGSIILPSLTTVFFAGEVFPSKHLNYWRRSLPQATFVNLYGPIEIHVDCTYYVVPDDFNDDDALPIGIPCRNTDILILNEQNQLASGQEPGELCVRGSSLALGYWNNPERTDAAFVQNPLNTRYKELVYRTGDVVYRRPDGNIMFVGRKDHQIKHLGYRIELGEIEHAVLRDPDMRNCCVVYNSTSKEIVLFFESDDDLPAGVIRQRLSTYLPKYMLPTVFKHVASLPRNPNGKIDRHQLLSSVM